MSRESTLSLFSDTTKQAKFIFSDLIKRHTSAQDNSGKEEASIIFLKRSGRMMRAYAAIYADPKRYQQKKLFGRRVCEAEEDDTLNMKYHDDMISEKICDTYLSLISEDFNAEKSIRNDYMRSLTNTLSSHYKESDNFYEKNLTHQLSNLFLSKVALRAHDLYNIIEDQDHHTTVMCQSFRVNIDDMMERADIMFSALYEFIKKDHSSYVDTIEYFLLFMFKLGFYQLEQQEGIKRKELVDAFRARLFHLLEEEFDNDEHLDLLCNVIRRINKLTNEEFYHYYYQELFSTVVSFSPQGEPIYDTEKLETIAIEIIQSNFATFEKSNVIDFPVSPIPKKNAHRENKSHTGYAEIGLAILGIFLLATAALALSVLTLGISNLIAVPLFAYIVSGIVAAVSAAIGITSIKAATDKSLRQHIKDSLVKLKNFFCFRKRMREHKTGGIHLPSETSIKKREAENALKRFSASVSQDAILNSTPSSIKGARARAQSYQSPENRSPSASRQRAYMRSSHGNYSPELFRRAYHASVSTPSPLRKQQEITKM